MISIFVRENQEYNEKYMDGSDNNWITQDNLKEFFGDDFPDKVKEDYDEVYHEVYKKLEEFNYIKRSKSSLKKIKFSFVGLIIIGNIILKSFPKYITKKVEPKDEFKIILKVIKKYNNKNNHSVYINSYAYGNEKFNMLYVMLLLVDDYNENGLYINKKKAIEVNGNGEILWDKTINESLAYIQGNKPYYFDTFNNKIADDNYEFFKRLHESVLTKISLYLNEYGLLELLDLNEIDISDEEIDDFRDLDFIINKLESELMLEFNTRKQIVLNALISYLSQKEKFEKSHYMSSFSTENFQSIWENICKDVMNDVYETHLEKLPLDDDVKTKYEEFYNFKSIIEKPIWTDITSGKTVSKDTLKPDCISLYTSTTPSKLFFIIVDAKYYHIKTDLVKNNLVLDGVPGIGDITKQYLYNLLYVDLINFIEIKQKVEVKNLLLAPNEDDEIKKLTVNLDMFTKSKLKLVLLDVFLYPANKIYNLYLEDNKNRQKKLEEMVYDLF